MPPVPLFSNDEKRKNICAQALVFLGREGVGETQDMEGGGGWRICAHSLTGAATGALPIFGLLSLVVDSYFVVRSASWVVETRCWLVVVLVRKKRSGYEVLGLKAREEMAAFLCVWVWVCLWMSAIRGQPRAAHVHACMHDIPFIMFPCSPVPMIFFKRKAISFTISPPL